MEYCCHFWAGAASFYLTWTLELFSISITLVESELAKLVPIPFSQGRTTHYSDRLHDFPVIIPRYYKDVYVSSAFPHTATLWNSLPTECFPLTYDLNGFKSKTNRNFLNMEFFYTDFLYALIFLRFFFCCNSCLVVALYRIPNNKKTLRIIPKHIRSNKKSLLYKTYWKFLEINY